MRGLSIALGAIVGAVCANASLARAEEPQDARRVLVEAAWQAHTDGDHAHAIVLAGQAMAMRKSAALFRFIAEEQAILGRAVDAYSNAVACVQLAETEPASSMRDGVLDACSTLTREWRSRVAIVKVAIAPPTPDGTRITVAGEPRDAGAIAVAPGLVRVEASAVGFRPFAESVMVGAGSEGEVRVLLVPEPAPLPAAPPADARSGARSVVAPILIGAGGLALGGALALHLVANRKYDDLRARCTTVASCSDYADERSSIERLDNLSIVATIVGSGLVVAGVTVFVVQRRGSTGVRAAWVSASPGALQLGGSF